MKHERTKRYLLGPEPKGTLETARTKHILEWINSLPGFKAVKRHQAGANRKGDPDITGCVPIPMGRRLELEVKQPGNKPTTIQEVCLNEWREVGALVGVVHDVLETVNLFKTWGLKEEVSIGEFKVAVR